MARSRSERVRRHVLVVTLALAVAVFGVVAGSRVLGPSDLYQNLDQSKTMAFTADMVLNGRWFVPVDGMGTGSKKPPLINYMGVPFVAVGWWSELSLKMPALVCGVVTAVLTYVGALVCFRRVGAGAGGRWANAGDGVFSRHAVPLAVGAAALWVASPSAQKHLYFLRPDAALIMTLTLGWVCATVALSMEERTRGRVAAAMGMWVATGLTVLAKGPHALFVPAYAVLAAWLIHGRVGVFGRTMPVVGSLVAVGIGAAWFMPAVLSDPEHMIDTVLRGEVGRRMAVDGEGSVVGLLMGKVIGVGRVIGFVFERFFVWALFVVATLVIVPPRRWARHGLAPAVLWFVLLVGVFAVISGRAGSYLAPAYPAGAVLAAYSVVHVLRAVGRRVDWLKPSRVGPVMAGLALVVGVGLAAREVVGSRAARTGTGEAIVAFAVEAERVVGDEGVVFVGLGHNPVPTLMGRHQGGVATETLYDGAAWVVAPAGAVERLGVEAVVSSAEMVRTKAQDREVARLRSAGVALFRREDGPAGLSAVLAAIPDESAAGAENRGRGDQLVGGADEAGSGEPGGGRDGSGGGGAGAAGGETGEGVGGSSSGAG